MINLKKILYAGLPVATSLLLGGCLMPTGETNTAAAAPNKKMALAASITTLTTTWTLEPGSALAIGAGAVSEVDMVERGTSNVKYWNGSSWVGTNGTANEVDVGAPVNGSTSVWVVGQNNRVYESHDNGLNWNAKGSQLISEIGVSTGGAAWGLGIGTYFPGTQDFHLYKWNPSSSTWDLKGGGGVRLDADPDGSVWVVNSSNQIWHCNSAGDACNMPFGSTALARDIGVGSNGDIWIIGTATIGNDYKVYKRDWVNSTWQDANIGGVRITVDANGNPWIRNSAGAIYKGQI